MEQINKTLIKKVEDLREVMMAGKNQKWLQKGFTIIANRAIIDTKLSNSDFRVYVILLMHLMNKETCFPSQATIGKESGLSARQVSRIIFKLKSLGYLKVENRKGKVNIYKPIIR